MSYIIWNGSSGWFKSWREAWGHRTPLFDDKAKAKRFDCINAATEEALALMDYGCVVGIQLEQA